MSFNPKNIASTTRLYRKLHRWVAVPLLLFMLMMGVTGLLLGWKKQTELLPKTEKGQSNRSTDWVKIDSIQHIAQRYATDILKAPADIDRIDIRPQKGVAKIVFVHHFTELQIDCQTGKILSVSTRKSDIIEKIHDGSLLDFWVGTPNDAIKLTYTSVIGLGLILLSISGFWLWYNPIRIRNNKHN
jgi:uncharacterized iron-regulated membrane protein